MVRGCYGSRTCGKPPTKQVVPVPPPMTIDSEIVQKGIQSAKEHPNFKKELGTTNKSSFSLEFSLPSDKDQPIYLELMFFHFPK